MLNGCHYLVCSLGNMLDLFGRIIAFLVGFIRGSWALEKKTRSGSNMLDKMTGQT